MQILQNDMFYLTIDFYKYVHYTLFKDVYKCNLIEAFKHFQDIGVLEIITCGATHRLFPYFICKRKNS